MKRRGLRRVEEQDDANRWMVSYADFITLLFAFFVVLYAISTINMSKYRAIATHIDASFSTAARALLPIQFGPLPKSFIPLDPLNDKKVDGPFTQASNLILEEEFTEVSSELKTSLQGLVDDEKLKIKETENWFEIELKSKFLFRSASARLLDEADDYLKPIAEMLNNYNNPIQVEGFTDNVPIENELYPSNWELSASRAARVARRLIDFSVDPVRIAAVGYGKNFPVATNATERGKSANRRVVILISKQPRRQRLVELQKRGNGVPAKPKPQLTTTPEPSLVLPVKPTQVGPAPITELKPIRTREGGVRFSTVPGRGREAPTEIVE